MPDIVLTTQQIVGGADALFQGQSGFKVRMQRLRPYICPFEKLISQVPGGSHVLDIGCGAGLFLGLAAKSVCGLTGIGFDADAHAIVVANKMARENGIEDSIRFERRDVEDGYPEGPFDLVAMIDVMHHIPVPEQRRVFTNVAACLRAGGLFLYKDIASDDRVRSVCNRCHDLAFARQWVRYLPRHAARKAATDIGLAEVHYERVNRLWYSHDLHVFSKA